MSMLSHYVGLLGCLLLCIALPLKFIRTPRYPRKLITVVIMVMIVIGLIPINELILIGYVRGVVYDLSITSIILLALFITSAYTGKSYVSPANHKALYLLIISAAVFVYPMGLGLGYWDSYATGYGNTWLYTLLTLLTLWLYLSGRQLAATIILLGVISYISSLLSSTNLWDYLVDPLLVIYVLMSWLSRMIKPRLKKPASAPNS